MLLTWKLTQSSTRIFSDKDFLYLIDNFEYIKITNSYIFAYFKMGKSNSKLINITPKVFIDDRKLQELCDKCDTNKDKNLG